MLETARGKIKRDDAVDLALTAISDYLQKQDEAAQVNVLIGSSSLFYPAPLFSDDALLQSFSEGNTECLKNAISITPFPYFLGLG